MDNNNSRTIKKTMPICLSSEEFKMLEEYSKKQGMLNCSQALEYLATECLKGSQLSEQPAKSSNRRHMPVR